MSVGQMYDFLLEMGLRTEEFLMGAILMGGYNEETMEACLYCATGYRSFEDFMESLED